MPLSIVVITKNEERNIDACLGSIRWADEIIVVDACSDDRTVDLARRYTEHVVVREWPGFGPQKNFAMDQATSEWILIVDADERVTDVLRDEILRTIGGTVPDEVAAFEIPRRNFFYGRWLRGGGVYPDYQIRLLRRGAGRYDDTLVHERLNLHGRISRLTQPLDHYSIPTVGHHFRKIARYTTLAASEKLKAEIRISPAQVAWHHLGTFLKVYGVRKGYIDGTPGLIAALFAAMYTFVKYAKAWALVEQRGKG
ncbi:glycosyltransferase family 2 protein [Nitrospira moscoviensis]|uniref:Lipopolysaccharide core biosynthesis glycosyltransferase WaaE n=1 Tax=Nitrospira moscoviensis TaxID=42253 RepID=A0A0K2GH34_NITMO|nr:glycosyltransferase family 2 protein [Nitrospira moscoviensis]ALA59912.1 Lipopolysaccharide core biosynthesis glycosyltransferase WaaE [Nitrospira moscoviensis]